MKATIMNTLKQAAEAAGLVCTVEERFDIVNLETVILSLGTSTSGLGESVSDNVRRDLVKKRGIGVPAVVQRQDSGDDQLPVHRKTYGQPQPPKQIAIYRPEETNPPHFVRHLEEFITEITNWEDYDSDRGGPRG